MFTRTLALAAGLALLGACSSTHPSARDENGKYATTSDYHAMDRAQLTAAMNAGLADVDKRHLELQARAQTLGQDAIDEMHDRDPKLAVLRTDFVNEMARMTAALEPDWKSRREDVVEAFNDLRSCLDTAYEEVLEA